MSEVGNKLKILRESVKLSQMKLGQIAGLKQATVNRYEHGGAEAPYRILFWYADYFDVSMDYIFGRCDKPQGKLYEYKPKIAEDSPEMRRFIEMCFDPDSPMNERLKQTLIEILKDGKK